MKISNFIECINALDCNFFTGVPDSQLSSLCDFLIDQYGISDNHIIAANEGNCVALAAGYHLSTGKIPAVYLQNSGLGNITNPVASLLNDKVYGIPSIFIVGWRGEPGVPDEPQHIFQGEITLPFLKLLDISTQIIDESTMVEELYSNLPFYQTQLNNGKSIAFVVKKKGLTYDKKVQYSNHNTMSREDIIQRITSYSADNAIVCTTGKASRELYEIRDKQIQPHKYDFLTVGSMGHCSSIALGIAISKPNSKIWCIDGDGAALMHMGAMALIGSKAPSNLIHIVINNEAHETVGGMPTVGNSINLVQIALGCGYPLAYSVKDMEELDLVLTNAKSINQLIFIEIKAALGSRSDLGRPKTSALDNKINFMNFLSEV